MDGASHVGFAIACELAAAHVVGLPPVETAVALVLAAGTSAGRGSPDMDNFPLWRQADKHIPDEALGCGGPMRHRGITHWWAWPALAALLAHAADLGSVSWVIWALILGWSSHLLGDFIFGIAPHGIPVAPWWAHAGIGWDSGGKPERFIFVPAALLGTLWWIAGHPGPGCLGQIYVQWASAR